MVIKNILTILILIIGFSTCAFAYDNPFETVQESRARHSAENYNTYQQNNYQAPLGGYSSPLGDSAPRGTINPGYVNSNNNVNGVNYYPVRNNGSYQGNIPRY